MDQFFTWEILSSFVGAVTATGIVTQCIKNVFSKIPTAALSYIVALVILLASTAASGSVGDWKVWALVPLNAVLISISANKAYDSLTQKK